MRVSLGKYISLRRKHLHMTQEDLANRIHVSKSAVAKWETDGGIPERDNFYKLAGILGVAVEDMYHLIAMESYEKTEANVNITAEVIMLLESYGYKVTRKTDET